MPPSVSSTRQRDAGQDRSASLPTDKASAIGRSGVGFFTFPNDGRAYFILRGPVALRVRNLFVWFLVFFLRLERKYPGLALFWIGRRRVSWQAANEAMRSLPDVGDRAVVVDVTSG